MPLAPSSSPDGTTRSPAEFYRRLKATVGGNFAALLAINYFFGKGYGYNVGLPALLPIFKDLGLGVSQYQKYYTVAQIGWSIKPLLGVLSDLRPILGFHKRWYLMLSCFVGLVSLIAVQLFPQAPSSGAGVALFCFGFQASLAMLDLLCEGAYTRKMAEHPKSGSSVVTWVWLWYTFAQIIAACVEGPMADHVAPRLILLTALPGFLFLIPPVLRGWLPEQKVLVPPGHWTLFKTWRSEQQRVSLAGIMMGTIAVGLAILNVATNSKIVLIVYCLLAIVVIIGASSRLLPRVSFRVMCFLFLKEVLYVHIRPTLDYWYTADSNCVPGGPHFDYTFYQTVGNIVQAVATLVGVLLFEATLSKGRFRTVYYLTTVLRIVSSFFDLGVVQRWNRSIGIPDTVFWVMGDQVLYQVSYMLDFMPGVILNSRVCPKNVEATMFAVMAGIGNFGQSISYTIGGILVDMLKINTSSGSGNGSGSTTGAPSALSVAPSSPCDFAALPTLIIISHFLLPFLTIPLIWFCIPDSRIPDPELGGTASQRREEEEQRQKETHPEETVEMVSHPSLNQPDNLGGHCKTSRETGDTEDEIKVPSPLSGRADSLLWTES
jgi:folate/biopterin transporter